jgi:hypothetical protein
MLDRFEAHPPRLGYSIYKVTILGTIPADVFNKISKLFIKRVKHSLVINEYYTDDKFERYCSYMFISPKEVKLKIILLFTHKELNFLTKHLMPYLPVEEGEDSENDLAERGLSRADSPHEEV